MPKSIARNTAFMTISSVAQKVLAFVYFTIIARQIGAEGTGKYFTAIVFTTVFVVFVDLGFTNVLIREAAKAKEKITGFLSTVLAVKVIFGFFTYLATVLMANLMGYSLEIKELIYLSAVTMLFDSLHMTMYGVLRAIGDLKWEGIGMVGSQILTLILGAVFLYTGRPLIFLILAFTIPSFINLVYVSFILTKEYGIKLKVKFDRVVFKHLGQIAIPFALAAIFARVYTYIDSILLSKLMGDTAVGLYSVAHKITFAFQFIPLALIAALYPRFSECFAHDQKRLAYIYQTGIKYLLLISFPIAVGIGVLAPDIIMFLYKPEYLPSVLPLQIMMIGLVFSFVSFPVGAFLNACNRQFTQTAIVGTVMVVNIVLNLILIPRFGLEGAAIASTLGSLILVKVGYLFSFKVVKMSHLYMIKSILQALVASTLMGLAVWLVNFYFSFILAIVAGALLYPVFLFAVRAVNTAQLKEAYTLLRH